MQDINSIITKAQNEIFPELEAKIRAELELKDKDWLIDQIIYLTCERHSLHEQKENFESSKKLIQSIKNKSYNHVSIENFTNQYQNFTRETVEQNGLLINAPHMGLSTIDTKHRSLKGESIFNEAKEMLYVLLYGDKTLNVNLKREQEEILTMTIPKAKSDCLDYLKAVTQTNTVGTWKDPEGVSNDEQTSNISLRVEFGDNKLQTIGTAVFVTLNLLNLLHINEQIFYAQMMKVERSSLLQNSI